MIHIGEHDKDSAIKYALNENFYNINNRLDDVESNTAIVNILNTKAITANVINAEAVANTMADITGLSFPVVANSTYYFKFTIRYDAAATTTGSRWSIDGPATPTSLHYKSKYPITATTETINNATDYNIPAASNASSLTTGNIAIIEGFITPSANGTVIARFASEVTVSAITALAGSMVQWIKLN